MSAGADSRNGGQERNPFATSAPQRQERGPRTARALTVEYLVAHYGKSVDRFWRRVSKQPDGCWRWEGAKTDCGYGVVGTKRGVSGRYERTLAHRFAFALARGSLAAGADLLHSCDRPWCVNPDHLRPGNQRENITDMHARGRAWWQQRAAVSP